LSGYKPVICLRGGGTQKHNEKWYLRKGLIIFQFTVSLIFIIGTIVISHQLQFIRNRNLGFTSEAVVTLYPNADDSLSKVRALAQKIMQVPGVSKLALESNPPLSGADMGMTIRYKNRNEPELGVQKEIGDENFIPLYQMRLLSGRNLIHSDQVKELVINETCSKKLGFTNPGEAVGQLLYVKDKAYPIVGVVADFHQHSFHELIKPMCILNQSDRERRIAVKLATNGKEIKNANATLSSIEKKFKEIYPNDAFHYSFFDESIAHLYEKDQRTGWLMNISMIITIFISCMGLFGVAIFTVEQRTKEIGIRKVLGATVASIVAMISKDFVILIVIALVISSPIAFYCMNRWLQGFAYRIDIHWWVFALAGSGAILIALSTVGFQAIRAAIANPVKSLRNE
jgi:putative ABC transport system permease protein